MCLRKVYVRDHYRMSGFGNYYNCGKCWACRQASSQRRARRILHHKDAGRLCYFITLTFDNDHIPYFKLSDLRSACRSFASDYEDGCILPLYMGDEVIDFINIDYELDEEDYKTLSGLCGKDNVVIYPDKISFAYSPIIQKFFKNLRSRLKYHFPERDTKISYYYAPEYGPTTQRFHAHLLIWFPTFLSEVQVKHHVCEAWPFASRWITAKEVQIARSPARYVASYINCSADVSEVLTTRFPLRPSHSLYFGFGESLFDLQTILRTYEKTGRFEYNTTSIGLNGRITEATLLFPKYTFYRYFPKCKGYSRLSRDQIQRYYTNARKYFKISSRIHPRKTESGIIRYESFVLDRYNQPVLFTDREAEYFINRLYRCYDLYWKDLKIYNSDEGVSFDYFVDKLIEVNSAYLNQLYRRNVEDRRGSDLLESYFNIGFLNGEIHSDLEYLCESYPDFNYDCNSFRSEIEITDHYEALYKDNIKTRKKNNHESTVFETQNYTP